MPELSTPPRRSSARAQTWPMSSARNGSSVLVTRTPPRVTDSVHRWPGACPAGSTSAPCVGPGARTQEATAAAGRSPLVVTREPVTASGAAPPLVPAGSHGGSLPAGGCSAPAPVSLPPSRALRWLREACPRRRDTATAPGAPYAAFGPAAAACRHPRSVAAGLSSGLREPGAAAGAAVAVRGRQPVDPVTEAVPLGGEVAQVLLRRLDREGDHAGYLDPAGGQPRYLRRVVGEQPHRAHAEVGEYLCADGVVPGIGGQAEFQV